jgi:superfamily I DNA and RNA helicase
VLFRRIEEQEERLFRLTEEQMRVLDMLQKHKRAVIEGVAGSGKTMLAKAQAQRFADQGLKTLLVCYNRVLAEWLKESFPEEYNGKITVSNFHRLCHEYCKDAGIEFISGSDIGDEFWRDRAPELLMQAIEQSELRFDAIVVDEGQDFFPNWWIPLEMISSEEEGPLYLFYDPAQNLFVGDKLSIPSLGTPITLPTNCRNTSRIAKTCSQIRGVEIPVRYDAPEGDETIVQVAKKADQQVKICEQIVGEWVGKGKLKPSQIAIQSPHSWKNSSFADVKKIRDIPLTDSLDKWKAAEGLLFKTIRSFKGLEADAVVVIDVPRTDIMPHFKSADLYVACSRAKHLLAVLPRSEGIL